MKITRIKNFLIFTIIAVISITFFSGCSKSKTPISPEEITAIAESHGYIQESNKSYGKTTTHLSFAHPDKEYFLELFVYDDEDAAKKDYEDMLGTLRNLAFLYTFDKNITPTTDISEEHYEKCEYKLPECYMFQARVQNTIVTVLAESALSSDVSKLLKDINY